MHGVPGNGVSLSNEVMLDVREEAYIMQGALETMYRCQMRSC